ncbi:MAG TPA: molybdenum cofactor biosynthesis protein MoaE [Candidatus Acidoferrum sp.]|nr:molybdenum cofactor biosynthesis protein MoaE [Candidatus Acidoferrum sp.]
MSTKMGVHEKGTISLQDIISSTKRKKSLEKAGAIALFIGVVRKETSKKEKVQKLTLEAYEEKANDTLADICRDLKKKTGIVDVQIHHLLGEFKAGDDLVYVLVAGSHRKDVFPVLEEAVERYKREAPIFKKEETVTKNGKTKAYWKEEKGNQHVRT